MKLLIFITTIFFASNPSIVIAQEDYDAGNKRLYAIKLEEIGEYDLAIEYYQKSNELSLIAKDYGYLTDNYKKMGEIYYKQKKY